MFDIERATRKATPALIALWGPSGSGKTYSALRIARGLVGDKGRIGMIDTENRRAEFYAEVNAPWDHLDFQPPFTAERYTQAFKTYHDAGGYDCIIVDSMSHVWEGEGGVLDQADQSKYTGLKKWQAPKMAYKRMVNNLLRSPSHVIFCLRAKEGVEQRGSGKDASIESMGLTPICEKNFIYEMTVSVLIGPDHQPMFEDSGRFRCHPMVPRVKAPSEIWGAIKPGEYLSEGTGQQIAEWIGGGAEFDNRKAELERVARDVATMGTAQLKQHWESLSKADQKVLLPIKDDLKRIAADADGGPEDDGEDTSFEGGNSESSDPLDDGWPGPDVPAAGEKGETAA